MTFLSSSSTMQTRDQLPLPLLVRRKSRPLPGLMLSKDDGNSIDDARNNDLIG